MTMQKREDDNQTQTGMTGIGEGGGKRWEGTGTDVGVKEHNRINLNNLKYD